MHRVFELHYETVGYPAYPYFAASMHYGLIARIEEIQRAPDEKREHALRTTITAPKALIHVIPREWLPPNPEGLTPEKTRAILEQAAQRLEGIEPATRDDYVLKLLNLLASGEARRPYRPRAAGLTYRPRRSISTEDFDDVIESQLGIDAGLDVPGTSIVERGAAASGNTIKRHSEVMLP